MTLESIKQAAAEFAHINDICMYVSKERFCFTAKAAFDISDEKTVDRLYGILNTLPVALNRLDRKNSEELESLIETAIKIGETAFSNRPVLVSHPRINSWACLGSSHPTIKAQADQPQ